MQLPTIRGTFSVRSPQPVLNSSHETAPKWGVIVTFRQISSETVLLWPSRACGLSRRAVEPCFYAAPTGILFVLETELRSRDLPIGMGCRSGTTCWWWLRNWNAAGSVGLHATSCCLRSYARQTRPSRRQFIVDHAVGSVENCAKQPIARDSVGDMASALGQRREPTSSSSSIDIAVGV